MADPLPRRDDGDKPSKSSLAGTPEMSKISPLAPTPGQAKHWAKHYRTEIAACSSSVLSTFIAYPLDSVKTRMQAYRFQHFTSCVQHTYKTEGFKGFWRGWRNNIVHNGGITGLAPEKRNQYSPPRSFAPLASVTVVRTISFSIYQKAKYKLSAFIGQATGTDEPLVVVNRPGSTPTFGTVACFAGAGAITGAIITVIACPFELTKLSAQISVLMAKSNSTVDDPVRRSYQKKGTFRTAKNIVLHRGFRGLYSGFNHHLLRDTIGTAIYFTTYESGKQLLVKFQGSSSPTSPLSVAMAGGLCGLVSWACIYPIDSAKTHYQRNCLTKAKGEPVPLPNIRFFERKMYRGLGVSMARSCVINTIFFSSFEFVKKEINNMPDALRDPIV